MNVHSLSVKPQYLRSLFIILLPVDFIYFSFLFDSSNLHYPYLKGSDAIAVGLKSLNILSVCPFLNAFSNECLSAFVPVE